MDFDGNLPQLNDSDVRELPGPKVKEKSSVSDIFVHPSMDPRNQSYILDIAKKYQNNRISPPKIYRGERAVSPYTAVQKSRYSSKNFPLKNVNKLTEKIDVSPEGVSSKSPTFRAETKGEDGSRRRSKIGEVESEVTKELVFEDDDKSLDLNAKNMLKIPISKTDPKSNKIQKLGDGEAPRGSTDRSKKEKPISFSKNSQKKLTMSSYSVASKKSSPKKKKGSIFEKDLESKDTPSRKELTIKNKFKGKMENVENFENEGEKNIREKMDEGKVEGVEGKNDDDLIKEMKKHLSPSKKGKMNESSNTDSLLESFNNMQSIDPATHFQNENILGNLMKNFQGEKIETSKGKKSTSKILGDSPSKSEMPFPVQEEAKEEIRSPVKKDESRDNPNNMSLDLLKEDGAKVVNGVQKSSQLNLAQKAGELGKSQKKQGKKGGMMDESMEVEKGDWRKKLELAKKVEQMEEQKKKSQQDKMAALKRKEKAEREKMEALKKKEEEEELAALKLKEQEEAQEESSSDEEENVQINIFSKKKPDPAPAPPAPEAPKSDKADSLFDETNKTEENKQAADDTSNLKNAEEDKDSLDFGNDAKNNDKDSLDFGDDTNNLNDSLNLGNSTGKNDSLDFGEEDNNKDNDSLDFGDSEAKKDDDKDSLDFGEEAEDNKADFSDFGDNEEKENDKDSLDFGDDDDGNDGDKDSLDFGDDANDDGDKDSLDFGGDDNDNDSLDFGGDDSGNDSLDFGGGDNDSLDLDKSEKLDRKDTEELNREKEIEEEKKREAEKQRKLKELEDMMEAKRKEKEAKEAQKRKKEEEYKKRQEKIRKQEEEERKKREEEERIRKMQPDEQDLFFTVLLHLTSKARKNRARAPGTKKTLQETNQRTRKLRISEANVHKVQTKFSKCRPSQQLSS